MVGDLSMSYVGAGRCRHVAGRAIGVIGMVFGGESCAVTGQTLAAIEGYPVFWGRRLMRVVAAGARHGISRFLLALALRQRFHLADGAQSGPRGVDQKKIADVVRECISGPEFVHVPSRAFDGGFPFQMALHANVIAARGSQLGGVDDCTSDVHTTVDVCTSGPVTAFARNSVCSERRLWIAVVGAGRGRLHSTHVATQAARVSGKI